METGAGFNLVQRNVLPFRWEWKVDEKATVPRLNDENGNPLQLREVLWLTTRFGNNLFGVKYIFTKRLSVDAIVGTGLMKRHIDAILSKNQKIKFDKGTVPFLGQGRPRTSGMNKPRDSFRSSEWSDGRTTTLEPKDGNREKYERKDTMREWGVSEDKVI